MCLTLYFGSNGDLPLRTTPELCVEEVEAACAVVRQWLSTSTVRFIGAHTGCSCGFPRAGQTEYWEDLPGNEDREADVQSLRALLAIVQKHVDRFGSVELYPVWSGNESLPPKERVELTVDSIDSQKFVFTEQFLYCMTRA